MKLLLDTNIIISREAHNVNNFTVSSLFKWIDTLKYAKYVHPYTKQELSKYGDIKLQQSILVKLATYQELVINNDYDGKFINVIKKYDMGKDRIDNSILFQVYIGRCDLLITEDKLIHRKAKELEIENKVLGINAFISFCQSKNPSLANYKYLPIKLDKFGNLDLKDTFFNTLLQDYPGFESWFNKNANDDVYITKIKDRLVGLLAFKIEDETEDYGEIVPTFDKKKRLKIRTLKVEATGLRLGERLIQVALINARRLNVDEVYVTLFEKVGQTTPLIDLLVKWGFVKYGVKNSHGKSELVFTKDIKNYDTTKNPRENYPLIKPNPKKFILPIEKEYHTNLFPESQLNNEKQTYSNTANRFAIQKVYISGAYKISDVKPGDIILIYRKGNEGNKKHTSVLTTLTIVHEIKKVSNLDQYLRECENRTVFSTEELIKFHPKYQTIIKLLEIKPLNKKIILDFLYKKGIIEEGSGPRPLHRLTDEQFSYIISESNTEF